MTDPILTRLTGLPRRGTLALPAPRPTYEVEARRIDEIHAELRFSHAGGVTVLRARLCAFGDEDRWHVDALLDDYRWEFTADERMTELRVRDMPQPRRVVPT